MKNIFKSTLKILSVNSHLSQHLSDKLTYQNKAESISSDYQISVYLH